MKGDGYNEETYWYEVKVTFIQYVGDNNDEKYINRKILVEAEELEEAIELAKEHLKDSQDEWFFSKIEETVIEEVIFLNGENEN